MVLPAAANPDSAVNIVINGVQVKPSIPAFIDSNGRTMVPLRFIMENMGLKVDWLANEQGIVIQRGATTIKLWIGKKQAYVNGQLLTLDTTPVLKNNTTMVPLRFISQASGGQVEWDSNTRTVSISFEVNSASGMVRLTGNYVNIRTGPGTNYDIITTLPRGTMFKFLGEAAGWYQVQLPDGRQGWVSSEYAQRVESDRPNDEQSGGVQQPGEPEPPDVSGPPAIGEVPPGQPLGLAVTGTKAVAIMAGPSPVEKQVGTAAAGSRLPIWQIEGNWWQVEYGSGQRGWVPAALVTYAPYEPPPGKGEDENSAAGIKITGVTVRPSGDAVEVSVQASEDFTYKISRWENRLIVDISGAVLALADGQDTVSVNHKLLARVRLGQYKVDTVRIVFDLNWPARLTAKTVKDNEDTVFVLERPSLRGSIIVIDPGHGTSPESQDPGAIGPSGVQEKNVNLAISQKLATLLRDAGVKVYMTRSGENTPYLLAERAYYANELGADIFISIHANASYSPSTSGTSTYFYAPPGTSLGQQREERQRLAAAIQSALVTAIGRKNLGVREANFSVLRNTVMPSVLVETAFISNPVEEKLLADPAFQDRVAKGIFNGISNYFAGF
ncbi:MAG: SH3 domain-containing protein [Clostridia bacterium]|nr:SH3 domain-containing protein [Clostridia bacterium]